MLQRYKEYINIRYKEIRSAGCKSTGKAGKIGSIIVSVHKTAFIVLGI